MKTLYLAPLLAIIATSVACSESATGPDLESPDVVFTGETAAARLTNNGATVVNQGSKDRPFRCTGFGIVTTDVSVTRRANGSATLSCHWTGLAPVEEAIVRKNFGCFLNLEGFSLTSKSRYTRAPSGQASMTCQFEKGG